MTTNHIFACDQRALEVSNLAKEILADAWVVIQTMSLNLAENFETSRAILDAKIIEISDKKPKKKIIQGEGVGLVDACFDAMIKCYDQDYCSLDAISIVDFTVNAHLEHGSKRKSDANVTAMLHVQNSRDHEYVFKCTTPSISHSSVAVVQEAIAFFINAELAYTRMHYALKDAQARGRHDLAARFQSHMCTLVHATSYENLVKTLRKNENQ
ncbi:MAG TPA: hypothetical protein VEL47_01755 [Myxococcota bacterium]|nr:hypothetical protein [Myxococcota bacterium]